MTHTLHKNKTRQSYDLSAEAYAQNVSSLHPHEQATTFLSMLPNKGKILDIGCGSGRDAKIFYEQGFDVLGIDFSEELLSIARKAVPCAVFQLMDIEHLDFPAKSFDGAWASASLLHIPKDRISHVLKTIHSLLKDHGVFYLSVKKGSGETFQKDDRYDGKEKFWSFFDEHELSTLLQHAGFEIVDLVTISLKISYETHPAIRIICKKKS